ncbi:hypothetical protein [Sphingobacterium sp. UBA5996]|uniref:hypothetical protein n=1 Tax=Sphingobacterium sp. UBA5996 TaxID=1947505 RepID=UPI0025D5C2A2|nr:hypothetical protein [Sphingobacterium sp. UBA5996]
MNNLNIRRVTILSLCLLGSFNAIQAQSLATKQDTSITLDTDKYRVGTNRFGDNFFINVGAGAQIYLGDHDKQMKFTERLTPFYSFNLGKWFSPGIGARVGVSGFKVKGLTQYFEPSHSTGVRYDGKPWDGIGLNIKNLNTIMSIGTYFLTYQIYSVGTRRIDFIRSALI